YPNISLQLILSDGELDVGMRQADVAIRLRQPTEQDLIQRKIFTVHFHIFASPTYLKEKGRPETLDDLDDHPIIIFGANAPGYLRDMNWLATAGRDSKAPRIPILSVNNVVAIKRAVQNGIGIAMLPDYLVSPGSNLVPIMQDHDMPGFDTYFVYPSELRNMKRIAAFRDFLIANARTWKF
ncbi:MAG: substrate binding domain-containing protein, partial [Alphaproteobacteria bacterium]